MTRLAPGGRATLHDRRTAEMSHRLLRDELTRVRTAALAWRNGLAGLLAALLGFGLIRGRSNVSDLAAPWHVLVGVALLAALLAGAAAALQLLWAAHGRPTAMRRRDLRASQAIDHAEALSGATALRLGIVLSLACTALLVIAVGITWYGPPRSRPALQVTTPSGTFCGTVTGVDSGMLTLRADGNDVEVAVGALTGVRPVNECTSG